MNRPPPQPSRESFSAEDQEAYDSLIARFRPQDQAADPSRHFQVGLYFGMLLNSPKTAALASRFGLFYRGVGDRPGSYSHADREYVDQVLSALWSTNVVQQVHIPDAVKQGVRLEAIEALRAGRDDLLTEDERLLATYIRQVVNGTVEPDIYARMEQRLGTRGLVEYTGFILWLQWTIRMMQAFDTGTISDQEVDSIIARLRSASRAAPEA